jgi:peptidoglycan/LPS O-acetylase OafA/YrhL
VTLVVVYHFHLTPQRLMGGVLGVDVFFVLSGYLITGILLDAGRIDRHVLARFWFRRVRRLLPPLLVVCVLTTLVVRGLLPRSAWPAHDEMVVSALLYTANLHLIAIRAWDPGQLPPTLSHTWSLGVEEQFYLAWPLLLAAVLALGSRLGSRRPRMLALGLVVAGIVASTLWTASVFGTVNIGAIYYSTWARAGELLVGAALALAAPSALAWARIGRRATGAALAGVGLLAFAVAVYRPGYTLYWPAGQLVLTVAIAAVVLGVEALPTGLPARVLSLPPLAAVGRVSYGVYLFHAPVADFVALPADGVLRVVTQVARLCLTGGLAALCFLLVERPLQRVRWPLVGAPRLPHRDVVLLSREPLRPRRPAE